MILKILSKVKNLMFFPPCVSLQSQQDEDLGWHFKPLVVVMAGDRGRAYPKVLLHVIFTVLQVYHKHHQVQTFFFFLSFFFFGGVGLGFELGASFL
jgi:hypothetical protein